MGSRRGRRGVGNNHSGRCCDYCHAGGPARGRAAGGRERPRSGRRGREQPRSRRRGRERPRSRRGGGGPGRRPVAPAPCTGRRALGAARAGGPGGGRRAAPALGAPGARRPGQRVVWRRHRPDGAAHPRRRSGPPDPRGLLGLRLAAPRADALLLARAVLRPGRPRAGRHGARHRGRQRGGPRRPGRPGAAVCRGGRRLGRRRGGDRVPVALRAAGPVGAVEPDAHRRPDGPAAGGRRRHDGRASLGPATRRRPGHVAGAGPPGHRSRRGRGVRPGGGGP